MNQLPQVLLTYIHALKSHDVSLVANTLAEDVRIVLATRTLNKKSFQSYLTALYTAFPDWQYQNNEPVAAHDGSISIRWRQAGTHTEVWRHSGFPPVAATGKQIQIPEQLFFYRVTGNLITEIRPDPIPGGIPQAIFEQLGVTDSML